MTQFNVLWWDFNKTEPTFYDVLPYFRREYEFCKKEARPVTKEQWKEFVERKGSYMFLSRAEYEIIVSPWPPRHENIVLRNFEDDTEKIVKRPIEKKVDIWQQIEPNIDLIVRLLMEEYQHDSK